MLEHQDAITGKKTMLFLWVHGKKSNKQIHNINNSVYNNSTHIILSTECMKKTWNNVTLTNEAKKLNISAPSVLPCIEVTQKYELEVKKAARVAKVLVNILLITLLLITIKNIAYDNVCCHCHTNFAKSWNNVFSTVHTNKMNLFLFFYAIKQTTIF